MMNRQLIAVGQFILSVAAGFAFGFLGVELAIGDLEFGFRLLLGAKLIFQLISRWIWPFLKPNLISGIICALVIALAEFYFLAKHLSDEDGDENPHKPNLSANANGVKPHSD